MGVTGQAAAPIAPAVAPCRNSLLPRFRPDRAETLWAVAFLAPYGAVFAAFVAYPIGFSLWLGADLNAFRELLAYPRYPAAVVNTLLLAGIGVNLKMLLAFLLSGLFVHRSRGARILLALFMLPWALPALPAYLSMHWMFIGYGGFLNSALEHLGVDGPVWFNSYALAIGVNVLAYIWKWLPFWTLVFLAGRLAIPREILEAAALDGATGLRGLVWVTFPLLANLYLVCTLLSALWTVGDFTTAYYVSNGAPALSTDVVATFAFRTAFDHGHPALGLAAVLAMLPVTVPLALILMRRLQVTGVRL